MTIQEGAKAPEFSLEGLPGPQTYHLSDFHGKWVVLYFYPKDMTPGCTSEAKQFRDFSTEFEKENAVIIGVSPDPVERHQKFIEKHSLNFYLLSDPDKDVLRAYQAWGKKNMYGRLFEGVIRSTVLIDPDGVIRKIWPRVRVKGHAEKVLETLRKLKSTS